MTAKYPSRMEMERLRLAFVHYDTINKFGVGPSNLRESQNAEIAIINEARAILQAAVDVDGASNYDPSDDCGVCGSVSHQTQDCPNHPDDCLCDKCYSAREEAARKPPAKAPR